jgi:hypothetical protein
MRSPAYITTLDPLSSVDMEKLEIIRNAVKVANKNRTKKNYVKCHARGPRVTAALGDGKHRRRYDQCLPLRHAQRLDVYIYTRNTY